MVPPASSPLLTLLCSGLASLEVYSSSVPLHTHSPTSVSLYILVPASGSVLSGTARQVLHHQAESQPSPSSLDSAEPPNHTGNLSLGLVKGEPECPQGLKCSRRPGLSKGKCFPQSPHLLWVRRSTLPICESLHGPQNGTLRSQRP